MSPGDDVVTTTMLREEFVFLITYDPERERSATRADLIKFIEHMQAVLVEGTP